jgi:hypothetical protein
MTETRKLAAILAADVVGFSRLTGAEEDRTLAHLRAADRTTLSGKAVAAGAAATPPKSALRYRGAFAPASTAASGATRSNPWSWWRAHLTQAVDHLLTVAFRQFFAVGEERAIGLRINVVGMPCPAFRLVSPRLHAVWLIEDSIGLLHRSHVSDDLRQLLPADLRLGRPVAEFQCWLLTPILAAKEPPPPAPPSQEVVLLTQIRDELAMRWASLLLAAT